MTTEQYIQAVLDCMPANTPRRSQIAAELRGHIAERLAAGVPLPEVLRQLGEPSVLAESYLDAVPLLLPPHGPRLLAKLVDAVIVLMIMAGVAVMAIGGAALIGEGFVWLGIIEGILAGSLLAAVYTVVAEWQYGRTVGKYLCGLYVVRESGARIGLGQAIVRQLPWALQVGWIDAAFVLFTDRRQRAFELLSKTRVVAGHHAAEPELAAAPRSGN